jgi:hypothetical protein
MMPDASKGRSLLRKMIDRIRRLLGKNPTPPGDPYAYVTAPVRRGPKGRSGAAVAELEDDSFHAYPPRR